MRTKSWTVTRLAAAVLVAQALLPSATSAPRAAAAADPVLVGAGGIASCQSRRDEATAKLLDRIPGTVFTAGDNAYEQGKASEWARCYDPTWGRHKARTRPAAGNHDWGTAGGAPYFDYFGPAAGRRGEGWYSYNLGAWHAVVLNSNCPGGCGTGSAQERWLRADLAASRARCMLAVIHHPRFSSDAVEGSQLKVGPFWQDLYRAGADLVISGHARVYERMVPQTPAGKVDQAFGLRLINVGTGGRGHASFVAKPLANSAVRDRTSFGVLRLTLHPAGYTRAFVPVAGARFTDTGSGSCHGRPAPGAGG